LSTSQTLGAEPAVSLALPPPRTRSRRRLALELLTASRGGAFGLLLVLGVVLLALLAPLIAPFDPTRQELSLALKPPVWLGGPPGLWLGADNLGRDIFSRIVYGSRVSLIIGLSAVAIGGTLGAALGMAAGYHGGWVETAIMRLADFQLSVPFIVLAIAVLGVLQPSLMNLVLVLGITGWVSYARVARSEVLSLREREFVLAARAVGATGPRIVLRHILPNVTASLVVIATLEVARMIISEAALSFLGLGVPPSTPSWGSMVADGRNYLETGWWIAAFPGLAIVLTVLGINLFGDWLRDSLDPRLRGR
jgi:peptide/nickel transport system permease protein